MVKVIAHSIAAAVILISGPLANASVQNEDCAKSVEGKVGFIDIRAFQYKNALPDPLPDPIPETFPKPHPESLVKVDIYIARKDASAPKKVGTKDEKKDSEYGPEKLIGQAPLRGWCEVPGEIKIVAKKLLYGIATREMIVVPDGRIQVNFRFWEPDLVVGEKMIVYNVEQDSGAIIIANKLDKAIEINSKLIVEAKKGGASAQIDGLLWGLKYVVRVGDHRHDVVLSEKKPLARLHVDAGGIHDLDEAREKKKKGK